VPALVSHLLETETFHSSTASLPPDAQLLSRLYVSVQITDSGNESLVPLAHSCLLELLRVYAGCVPNMSQRIPSFMEALPDHHVRPASTSTDCLLILCEQIWRFDAPLDATLPLRHAYVLFTVPLRWIQDVESTTTARHKLLFQVTSEYLSGNPLSCKQFELWNTRVMANAAHVPENGIESMQLKLVEHLESVERAVGERLESARSSEKSLTTAVGRIPGRKQASSILVREMMCAWRACIATLQPSRSAYVTKGYVRLIRSPVYSNMCLMHTLVSAFLLCRPNGAKLLDKYLPVSTRTVPPKNLCTCQSALHALRNKHLLVQEMRTGKLSGTVKTFYKSTYNTVRRTDFNS
jgi:hypothetical protein